MRTSMGRTGVAWDHAMAESFFAALKNERVYRTVYATKTTDREQQSSPVTVVHGEGGLVTGPAPTWMSRTRHQIKPVHRAAFRSVYPKVITVTHVEHTHSTGAASAAPVITHGFYSSNRYWCSADPVSETPPTQNNQSSTQHSHGQARHQEVGRVATGPRQSASTRIWCGCLVLYLGRRSWGR